MKKRSTNLVLLIFMLAGSTISGAEITKKFKVMGQCEMCQKRIEETATSLEGVENARWDQSNQNLTVSYDELKISLQIIQTAITMKGHDTELFNASDIRYNNLPDCCKYKRDDNKKINIHAAGNNFSPKKNGGSTKCVHDKSPTEGSCCEK